MASSLFPIRFAFLPNIPPDLHPFNRLTGGSVWGWLRAAFYSFRVMTLLRPTDLAPIGIAKFVNALQSLLGPLLLGLFALAVRQRLKR